MEYITNRSKCRIERLSPKTKKEKLELSFSSKIKNKDIIHHEPDPIWYPGSFVSRNVKNVITLHGVYPLIFPEKSSFKQKARLRFIRFISDRLDGVITVSNSEKRLINEKMNIPKEKIHVTYNGNDFHDYETSGRSKNPFEFKYVLHVSNSSRISGRKNPKLLFDAFSRVTREMEDIKLVIAGKGWKSSVFTKYLENVGIKKRVKRLGSVEPEQLPILYHSAEAYVQTSLWESFGMPIIEAMSFGTPVVTTKAYAIPEVAKDGVLYVDEDPEEVSNRITNVIRNPGEYEETINKAIGISKQYTWKRTSKATLEVYRKVVGKKS